MRILIAEDESFYRLMLENFLGKKGHEVIPCTDGIEAWNVLGGENRPPLAVLDWMMPGKTGIEICRQVRDRQNAKSIYIILLTAKDKKEDLVQGLEAGADDYITKPFDSREFNARLQVGVRVVELQEKLLKAERAQVLTQAAAAAAHEINNPLTAVMGHAELLAKTIPDGDPRRKNCQEILEGGRRITEIVRKMENVQQFAAKSYSGGFTIADWDSAARRE